VRKNPIQTSESVFEGNIRYKEISDQIKKVTYNTDNFSQKDFESRSGRAFTFLSAKVGKFIEAEFQQP